MAASVVIEMTAKEARLVRALQKVVQEEAKVQAGFKRVGQSAREAGREAGQATREIGHGVQETSKFAGVLKGQLGGIASMLGLGGGIAGAIASVNQGLENWSENLNEIASAVKQTGDEIIAFAALQEGGEKAKAVKEASALARRYGVTDRGEAFDTVQSQQSMLGTRELGLSNAETIFAANLVGIPVELGRELEVLGLSAGQEPGQSLRQAYAAGEMSGRTPAAMAKVAEAMGYYSDMPFMFALGSVLAGTVPENQIATFMKRGGQALTPTSGLKDWYEEHDLGKGEATQWQRFQALAEELGGLPDAAAINTALEEMGLTELRERKALADTLKFIELIRKRREEIPQVAQPGLLVQERADIEAELPRQRTNRELDILATMYADVNAFGPKADYASQRQRRQAIAAMALKNLGRETSLGMKTYTVGEDGIPLATNFDLLQVAIGESVKNIFQPWRGIRRSDEFVREKERIKQYLEATAPGAPPTNVPEPGTPEWQAWQPRLPWESASVPTPRPKPYEGRSSMGGVGGEFEFVWPQHQSAPTTGVQPSTSNTPVALPSTPPARKQDLVPMLTTAEIRDEIRDIFRPMKESAEKLSRAGEQIRNSRAGLGSPLKDQ